MTQKLTKIQITQVFESDVPVSIIVYLIFCMLLRVFDDEDKNIIKEVVKKDNNETNNNGVKMAETNLNLRSILLKLHLFEISKKYFMYSTLLKKKNLTKLESIKYLPKLYVPKISQNKGEQIKSLFSRIDIKIPDEGFVFFIDEFKTTSGYYRIVSNLSIDYAQTINSSLDELLLKYKDKTDSYSITQKNTLEGIELLINRIIKELKLSSREDKSKYIQYFENMKHSPVSTFEEGMQRILFYNQLLWQTKHELNGFGRLDKILNDIYINDSISKNEALDLIKKFIKASHSYYYYKSSLMAGDSGQIIVLGGLEPDNSYFNNDLTYLFIKAIQESQLPDPKLILRYSHNIPRDLMELSLKCIATGVGSPLISNDDIIVNKLIEFGYEKETSYNYVVSACWEPAPIGKGLEMNNVSSLVFLKPLNNMLDSEDLNNFENFEDILNKYKQYLIKYIDELLDEIVNIPWETDPLISFFIEDCDNKHKDVTEGGAIYNNYGLTSVSLANTINSLLNIRYFVFDTKEFDLNELNDYRLNNFDNTDILKKLKNQQLKFGKDEKDVVNLTNEIINCANDAFKKHNTSYGGKFKFGLSSPSYISGSADVNASFDGRKDYEPFSVHISLDDNHDYTELMRFASKLNYSESKFNGNVVDFMVTPDFINKNFDKFLDFIILSLEMGVFQIQLNVVDSKTLIDAQKNPDKYPNLIVRVWGFSSYFKDLPKSYQDLLIKRALKNESKNN